MMKFLEVRNFRIKCEITANRKDNGYNHSGTLLQMLPGWWLPKLFQQTKTVF